MAVRKIAHAENADRPQIALEARNVGFGERSVSLIVPRLVLARYFT
jgi:hypothetical protein